MEPIHEKWEEKIDIANDASLLNDLYSKHHETLMNFYLSVAKDYGNTAENNYRKVVEIFVHDLNTGCPAFKRVDRLSALNDIANGRPLQYKFIFYPQFTPSQLLFNTRAFTGEFFLEISKDE